MPKSLIPRLLAVLLVSAFAVAPVSAAVPAVTLPQAPNCPIFPSTNVGKRPVTGLAVRADSSRLMESIGLDSYLHPYFSSVTGGNYGIPSAT